MTKAHQQSNLSFLGFAFGEQLVFLTHQLVYSVLLADRQTGSLRHRRDMQFLAINP